MAVFRKGWIITYCCNHRYGIHNVDDKMVSFTKCAIVGDTSEKESIVCLIHSSKSGDELRLIYYSMVLSDITNYNLRFIIKVH